MKLLPFAASCALLVVSTLPAVTLAAGEVSQQDVPYMNFAWDHNLDGAAGDYTLFPPIEGEDFQVVGAKAGLNVDVGCDGLNLDVMLDSMVGQYTSIVTSMVKNAPTMAVNYLIYSSPTLYSLIQDMNKVAEFNVESTMMSCQSAREMAEGTRKAIVGEATQMCIEEHGSSDSYCNDGNNLGPYIDKVYQKRGGQWRTAINDAVRAGQTSIPTAGGSGLPGGGGAGGAGSGSPSGGENQARPGATVSSGEPVSLLDLMFSSFAVSDDIRATAEKVVPNTIVKPDGTIEAGSQQSSIRDVIAEKAKEVRTDMDKLVDQSVSADAFDTNSKEWKNVAGLPGTRVMSRSDFVTLKQIKRTNPAQYQQALTNLSTLKALNHMKYVAGVIQIGLRHGLAASGAFIDEDSKARVLDLTLPLLEQEISLYETHLASQKAEGEMMRAISAGVRGTVSDLN